VHVHTLQCMNYSNTVALVQPATGPSRVCEGSDVSLQCVIVLNPGNTVQGSVWSRNGMLVTVTNSSGTFNIPNHNELFNSTTGGFTDLVITNVSLDDDNVAYSCSATGTDIVSALKLNVTGMYTHTHTYTHMQFNFVYVLYVRTS